jgi:predicted ATPase
LTTSLTAITIRNYKNLHVAGGLALGKLNIFIGPNGSGKSNLMGMLQFLQQGVAEGGRDPIRGRTSFEDAIFNLGGGRVLDGTVAAPATVNLNYRFANSKTESQLQIELLVQNLHRQVIIDQEALVREQGLPEPLTIYQAHDPQVGGSGQGSVSVFTDTENPTASIAHEQIGGIPVNELALAVMPKLLETSAFPPERTPVYEARRDIIDTVAQWRFYNANHMNLADIRSAEPKLGTSDIFLSPSGENLPLVLYNLGQASFEFEETVEQAIKTILPDTRKLRAVTSGRLSLTIEWHVQGCKDPFFLSEMSDGTVRMLCWAIILHSPQLPSLIAIDEPEVGIHVAWLPILAAWIKEAARHTQVIISTHSPDLLDHFTDQLNNNESKLYVFQADLKSKNHFVVNQLMKTAVATQLDEGWQVGDLYRVGDPSVGGWPW